MSWQCWCGCINVNRCRWCNYCRAKHARISLRPSEPIEYDDWDEIVQERELWKINKAAGINASWIADAIKGNNMTPQEKLFSELFNGTKVEVKDMDALTLRAYREQLSAIAFEARAKLAAVDDEINERKPKKTDKGFQTSLGQDDNSKQIINTINDRQKRLTKNEKMIENMKKMGMDTSAIDHVMSAGGILERLKEKGRAIIPERAVEDKPKFVNPFEKK